jgi:predicted molibdopterin-dependent oxidoreductase YjgC
MLCGNMGIRGGGVNPLRGQNNVQGACDMGGLPNVLTAYQPVGNLDAIQRLEEAWNVTGLSTTIGLKVTEMLPKAHEGELKAMYIIGENPMVSDADLNHAEACFDHLDFLVVQDIFLTETAQKADVVLPSKCFAEKEGTFSNTERKVQRVRKAVEPPGEVKDDWQITCELATAMGYEMAYENSEEIFDELASLTPSYKGISYARIENEGIHWPCPTPEHPGTPILHGAQFTRGKGLFHAIDWIAPAEVVERDYPMSLTTGRVLYHYHTGTMTMKTEGLNERSPEAFVEIARSDAQDMGIEDGDMVSVFSRRGKIKVRARVSFKAVEGTVFIPFHFAQAAANKLTHAALDPISGIPEFKVCAVKVAKMA